MGILGEDPLGEGGGATILDVPDAEMGRLCPDEVDESPALLTLADRGALAEELLCRASPLM
jgi:hypothetical protein